MTWTSLWQCHTSAAFNRINVPATQNFCFTCPSFGGAARKFDLYYFFFSYINAAQFNCINIIIFMYILYLFFPVLSISRLNLFIPFEFWQKNEQKKAERFFWGLFDFLSNAGKLCSVRCCVELIWRKRVLWRMIHILRSHRMSIGDMQKTKCISISTKTPT